MYSCQCERILRAGTANTDLAEEWALKWCVVVVVVDSRYIIVLLRQLECFDCY